MSRRSFLALLGWGAFVVASLVALFESIRFVFPNATYEQPSAFKAGAPADYAVGSTTVFIDQRVVINRDPDGIYAFNLICTHLGCTPRSFPDVTSDLVASGRANLGPAHRPGGDPSQSGAAGLQMPMSWKPLLPRLGQFLRTCPTADGSHRSRACPRRSHPG